MRPETRHSLVLIVGTGITTLLAITYNVYAGRVLGRVAYGDFVAVISLVALCHIALGPINGTVARFTAQYATENSLGKIRGLWREVSRRVVVYGLVCGVIALALAMPIASVLKLASPWSVVAGIAIIYTTLLVAVSRGALRGLQSFGGLNVNTITEAAVRLLAGVLLLHLWLRPAAGLSSYVLALLVAYFLSRWQLGRRWSGHPPRSVDGAAVRRFTLPLLVMAITSAGLQNVDMLLAKRFVSEADAGIYGAAFTLSRSMSALVTPFTTLLLPLITQLHTQRRRVAGTLLRTSSYFLILAAVLLILFALWPERIVVLLYDKAFASAGAILLPLTVTRLFGYLGHMIALALAAMDRFEFLWVYVGSLLVQIVLLAIWHESSAQIATISVYAQGGMLAAMILFQFLSWSTARPARDAK